MSLIEPLESLDEQVVTLFVRESPDGDQLHPAAREQLLQLVFFDGGFGVLIEPESLCCLLEDALVWVDVVDHGDVVRPAAYLPDRRDHPLGDAGDLVKIAVGGFECQAVLDILLLQLLEHIVVNEDRLPALEHTEEVDHILAVALELYHRREINATEEPHRVAPAHPLDELSCET